MCAAVFASPIFFVNLTLEFFSHTHIAANTPFRMSLLLMYAGNVDLKNLLRNSSKVKKSNAKLMLLFTTL